MCYEYEEQFATAKVILALNDFAFSSAAEDNIDFVFDGIDYVSADTIYHSKNYFWNNKGTGDIILLHLKSNEKSAVTAAVQKLKDHPYVAYAEPDYLKEWFLTPNDPLYNELWGLKNIMASLAWNYTIGSTAVPVGIIDSGIDHNHPDIRANMWVSPDRRLENGWNFAADNNDSMDTNGHGTHIAGTIGAVGNNHIGIVGVSWKISVASLKFGLDVASAVAAINFANQFDIPILNASWGSRNYSHALKHAIEQYDGLFVTAAGNSYANIDVTPYYPGSYDSANIINVAALNPDNTLAAFSNYGAENADIAAPGVDILSLDLNGGYSPMNGTSMAAPHVAGAAALLKAYVPDLSAADIKNIILSTVTRQNDLCGKVLTCGRLNLSRILENLSQRFNNSTMNHCTSR